MEHDASPPARKPEATLHVLVRCPDCARQYHTDGRRAGERFRCSCGAGLTVPAARPVEAAVVRCASCGAARGGGESVCRFCGAEYSLLDRDRNTLCPACAARIPDRARFCPRCAVPILPVRSDGSPTDRACPACGPERRLISRALGELDAAALECPGCTGLWLEREVFERLAAATRREQAPFARPRSIGTPPPPRADRYRPCPECGKLMLRRNQGGRSGVLIDLCHAHGLWFDAEELDRILDWLRGGGAEAAEAARLAEQREQRRAERLRRELADAESGQRGFGGPWTEHGSPDPFVRLLEWLAGRLGGLF